MQIYAQDLNQNKPLPSSASSAATTQNINFPSANINLTNIRVDQIIGFLNIFLLAWSVFYCFFCLITFFNNRIYFGGGELATEKGGMQGIYAALQIAWTYVATLPFFALFAYLYTAYPLVSIAAILLYVIVFLLKLSRDIHQITPFFMGFSWSASVAKFLQSIAIWGKK